MPKRRNLSNRASYLAKHGRGGTADQTAH